jgi:hypothetical protein
MWRAPDRGSALETASSRPRRRGGTCSSKMIKASADSVLDANRISYIRRMLSFTGALKQVKQQYYTILKTDSSLQGEIRAHQLLQATVEAGGALCSRKGCARVPEPGNADAAGALSTIRARLASSVHLCACTHDPRKHSAKVSRTFRRFHAHGLIAKIPRTRRWRVTLYGCKSWELRTPTSRHDLLCRQQRSHGAGIQALRYHGAFLQAVARDRRGNVRPGSCCVGHLLP